MYNSFLYLVFSLTCASLARLISKRAILVCSNARAVSVLSDYPKVNLVSAYFFNGINKLGCGMEQM